MFGNRVLGVTDDKTDDKSLETKKVKEKSSKLKNLNSLLKRKQSQHTIRTDNFAMNRNTKR